MVRFFHGVQKRTRGNLRAALVRGAALAALLSLVAGAARVCVNEAQPVFFSLLFPQLMQWLDQAWDGGAGDALALGEATPGEAVAL